MAFFERLPATERRTVALVSGGMSDYYVLRDDHDVEPCDLETWSRQFPKGKCHIRVAHDEIGDITIDTVFLGYNMAFKDEIPLLYETMVFRGEYDQHIWRCPTWRAALIMHERVMQLVCNAD